MGFVDGALEHATSSTEHQDSLSFSKPSKSLARKSPNHPVIMLTPIKAVLLVLLASSSAIAVPVVGTAPGEPKPTKGLGFPSVFPTGGHPKPTFAARAPSGGFSHPGYSKPSNESSHRPSGTGTKPSGTGTKPSFTPYKLFV